MRTQKAKAYREKIYIAVKPLLKSMSFSEIANYLNVNSKYKTYNNKDFNYDSIRMLIIKRKKDISINRKNK